MLCIIKRTFLLIIVLLGVNGCQLRPVSGAQKSAKVKARIEKKQKAEREKKKNAAIKKHYNSQAESTQELMKQNKADSDRWRKANYHNKPIRFRMKGCFSNLKREPKPKDGIVTKKQLRSKKSTFIKRIFSKKKKK